MQVDRERIHHHHFDRHCADQAGAHLAQLFVIADPGRAIKAFDARPGLTSIPASMYWRALRLRPGEFPRNRWFPRPANVGIEIACDIAPGRRRIEHSATLAFLEHFLCRSLRGEDGSWRLGSIT
jgi:hypothetical protein